MLLLGVDPPTLATYCLAWYPMIVPMKLYERPYESCCIPNYVGPHQAGCPVRVSVIRCGCDGLKTNLSTRPCMRSIAWYASAAQSLIEQAAVLSVDCQKRLQPDSSVDLTSLQIFSPMQGLLCKLGTCTNMCCIVCIHVASSPVANIPAAAQAHRP